MKRLSFIFFSVLIFLTFTGCDNTNNSQNNSNNILKKNYTVSLYVDNVSEEEIKVDDGEVLSIDYTPKKDNHFFNGWYTDSSCSVLYDFSQPVTTNFKLYAGFVLSNKTISCKDIKIKALSKSQDNDKSFNLSLASFDYNYLEKNSMGLKFTITYDVKYTKDYDVLWDIGYAGAPKYELSLINSSLVGYFETNLTTTTIKKGKKYSYTTPLSFSKDSEITLIFSTDYIQNIISFSDIRINIDAVKIK